MTDCICGHAQSDHTLAEGPCAMFFCDCQKFLTYKQHVDEYLATSPPIPEPVPQAPGDIPPRHPSRIVATDHIVYILQEDNQAVFLYHVNYDHTLEKRNVLSGIPAYPQAMYVKNDRLYIRGRWQTYSFERSGGDPQEHRDVACAGCGKITDEPFERRVSPPVHIGCKDRLENDGEQIVMEHIIKCLHCEKRIGTIESDSWPPGAAILGLCPDCNNGRRQVANDRGQEQD